MVCGGIYFAAYALTLTTAAVGPASYAVTRADTDLPGLYRKVQAPEHAAYPGSKQEYRDGRWFDVPVEVVGQPAPSVAPTELASTPPPIAPPLPPTRGPVGQEVIAAAGPPGRSAGLASTGPSEPDLGAQARKRRQDITQFNAVVLARILPELMEF